MGKELVVQNLNMQSESADLIGGFKPIELRQLALPLYDSFLNLFEKVLDKNVYILNYRKI